MIYNFDMYSDKFLKVAEFRVFDKYDYKSDSYIKELLPLDENKPHLMDNLYNNLFKKYIGKCCFCFRDSDYLNKTVKGSIYFRNRKVSSVFKYFNKPEHLSFVCYGCSKVKIEKNKCVRTQKKVVRNILNNEDKSINLEKIKDFYKYFYKNHIRKEFIRYQKKEGRFFNIHEQREDFKIQRRQIIEAVREAMNEDSMCIKNDLIKQKRCLVKNNNKFTDPELMQLNILINALESEEKNGL